MSIILIIIIGVVITVLGIIGYLEKLFGLEIPRVIYIIFLAIFILISGYSLYRQVTSEVKMSELELRANTIQSIQLRVSIEATTSKKPISDKRTSAGLGSAAALFTEDKTRYRFITDYQYSTQQISENTNCLTLVYEPEDPTQLYGKPIDFLDNIDVFVCNYSSFFQTARFDPGSMGNSIDITVFINGVDVVAIRDKMTSPGVLAGGQVVLDINKEFTNISEKYLERLQNKNH